MNKHLKCSLCLCIGLMTAHTLQAQEPQKQSNVEQQEQTFFRGQVLNEEGKPLSLATIALLGTEGELVDGTVVNQDGSFRLKTPDKQVTTLLIQMMGYETLNIPIDMRSRELGKIRLKASSNSLAAVEVKASKRQAVNMLGTSLNASVASSVLGDLPSVLHILSALPFVSATREEVTVQGRGKAIIYYGHQLITQEDLLRLNPKDIKDIEVILLPDASYPADTPAVIKIKPKSVLGKRLGVYLQTSLESYKHISNTQLAQGYYDSPKLSLKIGAQHQDKRNYEEKTLGLRLTDEAQPTLSQLNTQMTLKVENLVAWADAVYRINKGHEVGVKYTFVHLLDIDARLQLKGNLRLSNGQEKNYNSDLHKQQTRPLNIHSLNTYYHAQLSPQWVLHAELNYFQRKQALEQNMNIHYTLPKDQRDWERSLSASQAHNYAWRAYIERKLKKGKIQLGQDGAITHNTQSYRQLNQAHQQLLPDTHNEQRQSNLGLFSTWTHTWSNTLSHQVGLRLESQNIKHQLRGQTLVNEHQLYLFPSFTINYRKGGFSGSLTYENSIRNPNYQHLSSDIIYIDELTLQSGNPYLKPHVRNKLSLNLGYKGLTLIAQVNHSKNTTNQILERYERDRSRVILIPRNINVTKYRLGMSYAPKISFWQPTWSFDLAHQQFNYAPRAMKNPILDLWWKNLFSLPLGFTLQANLNGYLGGSGEHEENKGYWLVNLNLNKQFGSAWSLSIGANDLFATADERHTSYYSIGEGYYHKYQRYPRLELQVSYNFQARANKYKGDTAGQAERSRF